MENSRTKQLILGTGMTFMLFVSIHTHLGTGIIPWSNVHSGYATTSPLATEQPCWLSHTLSQHHMVCLPEPSRISSTIPFILSWHPNIMSYVYVYSHKDMRVQYTKLFWQRKWLRPSNFHGSMRWLFLMTISLTMLCLIRKFILSHGQKFSDDPWARGATILSLGCPLCVPC